MIANKEDFYKFLTVGIRQMGEMNGWLGGF